MKSQHFHQNECASECQHAVCIINAPNMNENKLEFKFMKMLKLIFLCIEK